MKMGDVIRKHRKNKNMTQETMAARLGVTAPAVNKWEKGKSLPDIALISPIARLLNISTDELLNHQQALSAKEVDRLLVAADKKLKTEGIEDGYEWMKQCLFEHPSNHYLALNMTSLLDSQLQMMAAARDARYDDFILAGYLRALESDDENLKSSAAEALYYRHIRNEEYEKAEAYLDYFSQNSERKQKQALIYQKTDRQQEAYPLYEEIIYAGYQRLSAALGGLYSLARQEEDKSKAHWVVEKMQGLAKLLEFGEYHEVSVALELAQSEKNVEETLDIMSRMLNNLESISGFTQSRLYAHMTFKDISEDYIADIREGLLESFRDEQSFGYLKEDVRWQAMVGEN
ncbi:MAG: helix-turn-helix transcriptional regulator [Eubacteriales bacterium]